MVINNKIILFIAWEENPERASTLRTLLLCFLTFLYVPFIFPLAARGAEGASQLPHRWLCRCLLGRQGIHHNCWSISALRARRFTWILNNRGKAILSRSRWAELKPAIIPSSRPRSECRFLVKRGSDPLTIPLSFKKNNIFMLNSSWSRDLMSQTDVLCSCSVKRSVMFIY